MKGKKSDYAILLIFLLFLYGILAANLLTKDRKFSPMENRMLAQKPKLTLEAVLSGSYMESYEKYMTDQFAARDTWISLRSLNERALGKQVSHGVYYGKDGYLAEQLISLNEEQLEKNRAAVEAFCRCTDSKVYFALIPGSVEINRDKFSPFLSDVDQKAVIEDIYQGVSDTGAICVDLYDALWEHRQEDLFYRTDHHWTSLGAYYGYEAFLEAKGEQPAPLSVYTKTLRSDDFYGTLYSKTGAFWLEPDQIHTYVEEEGIEVLHVDGKTVTEGTLYEESWLNEKDQYSMFLGGNQPLAMIRTKNTDMPKLLVIRDSYFDAMAPFLTSHYSEIYVVDFRYNRSDVEAFMQENGITEVLICYSLANFHEDANLAYVLKK